MYVVFKVILAFIFLLGVQGEPVRFDNYEPRRPIKYLYHLLELKAAVNPLLYPITSTRKVCSSKIGPFCDITAHIPLQTHQLKETTNQMDSIKAQSLINVKYYYETYLTIEKSEHQMFLIRNNLVNMYEAHLKRQMGEMNKEEMLSSTKFKSLLQEE